MQKYRSASAMWSSAVVSRSSGSRAEYCKIGSVRSVFLQAAKIYSIGLPSSPNCSLRRTCIHPAMRVWSARSKYT